MIPVWLGTALKLIGDFLGIVEKAIPPDEIRIDNHNEKEPLRKQDFRQNVIEDDFDYVKSRPEIDITNYLREVHGEVSKGYIKLITERVTAYRKDVVKRKGWRWRKHRDWLESQVTGII